MNSIAIYDSKEPSKSATITSFLLSFSIACILYAQNEFNTICTPFTNSVLIVNHHHKSQPQDI